LFFCGSGFDNILFPIFLSVQNEAEISRLRNELERIELATQETILGLQSKHNNELATIREQFEDGERRTRSYEMEIQSLREKLDKARLDSLQVSKINLSFEHTSLSTYRWRSCNRFQILKRYLSLGKLTINVNFVSFIVYSVNS
jgi:sensor histidine kinase YesM